MPNIISVPLLNILSNFQLKEVEASASKWRKNKKDLESQLDTLNKHHVEVIDKTNQKKNDLKYLDMEITGFKKRIEDSKKETTATKNSLSSKKKASDVSCFLTIRY